ncbi:MAG TPA: Fe-S cluster assembly protein SufD [Vicinamibacterales bacterium]|nr:Fe-S cluster assembly protein SufD [Vicinamibacterales bacterium]
MPVAERQSAYAASFEAFRRSPDAGPDWLRDVRDAAFARFQERGFPTTRDEEWRFTNVAPIAGATFERAASGTPSSEVLTPALFEEDAAAEIVVVNGRMSRALSSLEALPRGVVVRHLRDHWQALNGHRAGAVPSSSQSGVDRAASTPFTDLNLAFFEDGLVIDVDPKTIVRSPIHVLFLSVAGAAPAMMSPRLSVVAGEQSQISIIESYVGAGAGVTFSNAVTEFRVGANAVVNHVKIQRELPTAFHIAHTTARLDRSATLVSHAISLGGRIARNDILAVLDGEGAECTLNGLYIADGETLVDTHSTIDHAKPHCPSHELYKGILAGRARAVFNGKIIVRPDAQKTDAKQTNKALLLTDEAQINTKPQLEIFADDVKCTHGAAIGQLDEDAMFYMRARGIAEVDARNLLIHAFANDVLTSIKIEGVRQRAIHWLEEKLRLPEA